MDRADRGRQRRLARHGAPHRDRVGGVRHLGPAVHPALGVPGGFPLELPDQEVFGRGGAAIIEPTSGKVIAGPLYDQEGMVFADCDLRRGLHAKRWFDAVGHYAARRPRNEGEPLSPLGHCQRTAKQGRTSRTPVMSGERVLVTGGSGFLGAHCILQLLAAGHRVRTTVRSLAREPACARADGARDAGDALSFAAADLTSDAGWPEAARAATASCTSRRRSRRACRSTRTS